MSETRWFVTGCAAATGPSLTMQSDVGEIKLRAQRRGGELLAEMEKHQGGKPVE